MTGSKRPPPQRDWLSKTAAGGLLGLSLALACSAMFVRFAGQLAPPVRAQLAMWLVVPIWFGVLGSSYFFASGKRAWLWLGLANLSLIGLAVIARRG
jgi:hypothetical protein